MAKVSPPFVRSAYNYDTMAASNESGLDCQDDSLAQQHFRDDCDINVIVNTFVRTGELPDPRVMPQFGDFSGVRDFHSALNQVLEAQEAFLQLSPQVRARFNNDPGALIDFLNDDANYDEAVKLGLAVAPSVGQDLSTPDAARSPTKRSRAAGVDKSVKRDIADPDANDASGGGE